MVGPMRLAPHLACLEIAMLHGIANMQWVMVEVCELATLLVTIAHVIQFPLDPDASQLQQRCANVLESEHI